MFFDTGNKTECFGCEACVQSCSKNAIRMEEDSEGFRYPRIDTSSCIKCGLCRSVCPVEHMPPKHGDNKYCFGGYHLDPVTRFESTSGGAFSAIVDAFCDENYVIFGAEAKGLLVFHGYITDKKDICKFRKSKYSQSVIGFSYRKAKRFLQEGKKVLFSGTPCQIAGLLSFLGNINKDNLLTVEVICEGVPSPLYIRKLDKHLVSKYGAPIETIDYRYTGHTLFHSGKRDFEKILLGLRRKEGSGKWDFEIMRLTLASKRIILTKDRWFNPFWSIWLNHLMSRQSCYQCPFTITGRIADISLGDLWGVHLYCPELYGRNGGSSLIVCNTEKGKEVVLKAQESMFGHELQFEDAIKYQSPMQKSIAVNPARDAFMADLRGDMDYPSIAKKWAKKPSFKLLFSKYIWGNRQKIFIWNMQQIIKK